MQRYFLAEPLTDKTVIKVTGDAARHITKVMRMTSGDKIECCDNSGSGWICEITDLSDSTVTCQPLKAIDHESELPVHVTLAQGLPKKDKLEWIVQKGTELGANAFLPVMTERSVVKWKNDNKTAKKLERLNKIALEAAEQSKRQRLPRVLPPADLEQWIERAEKSELAFCAYEEEGKKAGQSILPELVSRLSPGDSVEVLIGPEGGFSEKEAEVLKENNIPMIGLGPRILRTETAPLYVLTVLSYELELRSEVND